MFIIFDTETTGLPKDDKAPLSDSNNWPRVVQIAWQLHDSKGHLINKGNVVIRPDGFTIPYNATKIHGISTDFALANGIALKEALDVFLADASKAKYLCGHNLQFDLCFGR